MFLAAMDQFKQRRVIWCSTDRLPMGQQVSETLNVERFQMNYTACVYALKDQLAWP